MNLKEYFIILCIASVVLSAPLRSNETAARQNLPEFDTNDKRNFESTYPDFSELEYDEDATRDFAASFQPRIHEETTIAENNIGNTSNDTNTTISENILQNDNGNEKNRSVPEKSVDNKSKSKSDFRSVPEANTLETDDKSEILNNPVSRDGYEPTSVENVTDLNITNDTERKSSQPKDIETTIGNKIELNNHTYDHNNTVGERRQANESNKPTTQLNEAENTSAESKDKKLKEKSKQRNDRIKQCMLRKQQERIGGKQLTLNNGTDTYEDSYEYIDD